MLSGKRNASRLPPRAKTFSQFDQLPFVHFHRVGDQLEYAPGRVPVVLCAPSGFPLSGFEGFGAVRFS